MTSDALLTELLQRLERSWASQPDHRLARTAVPGVSPEEVEAAFTSVGLPTPDEAIEWFGWHNAGSINADAHQMPGIDNFALMSLTNALNTVETLNRVNAQTEWTYWSTDWFPLMHDGGGGYLLIDAAGACGRSTPVLVKGRDEGRSEARIVAPSLAALVAYWVDLIERGSWRFRRLSFESEGGGMWVPPDGQQEPPINQARHQ